MSRARAFAAAEGWIPRALQTVELGEVARALGLTFIPSGSHRGIAPCPACKEARRGSGDKDKRPPVGVSGRGGWRCHRCGAGGDAVELAAVALQLRPGPDLRAWFAERWSELRLEEPHAHAPAPTKRAAAPVAVPAPPPPPAWAPPPPPAELDEGLELPGRMPWREVIALWAAAAPAVPVRADEGRLVCEPDPRAGRWLAARAARWGPRAADELVAGLAVAELAGEPLCRLVAPPPAPSPAWASIGRRSWAAGWPLALPVYDAGGRLVALRARRCAWTVDEEGAPAELRAPARWTGDGWAPLPGPVGSKEVSPHGEGYCRGAVYADAVGRAVLRGEVRPGDPLPRVPGLRWSGAVLIVEGGVDYLRRATEGAGLERYAVLGVWSGAWPDDPAGDALAAALARAEARLVVVATDEDGDGHRYAAAVAACLARAGVRHRVRVARGGGDGR
jgi:hypothetical protein